MLEVMFDGDEITMSINVAFTWKNTAGSNIRYRLYTCCNGT